MSFNNIKTARKILHDYNNGVSGSFATALLDAWGKADFENRFFLGVGFPALERAIKEFNICKSNKDFYRRFIKEK